MPTRDQGVWSILDKACPLLRQDGDVSGPVQEAVYGRDFDDVSVLMRLTTPT